MIIEQRDHIHYGRFRCMASPCEVLIDTTTNSALEQEETPADLARWTLEWVQQIAAAYRTRNAA